MPSLEDRVRTLQSYVNRIPEISMANYQQVIASWKKAEQEHLAILLDVVRKIGNVPPAS